MKLWAMLCGATQDGRVTVMSSDKMWSTREGNGTPLQYSFLENPMKCMKRQKNVTLKDEPWKVPPGKAIDKEYLRTKLIVQETQERWCFSWLFSNSQVALVVKNSPATEDVGSISGLGRSPGGRHGNPLKYSCLDNSMDRGNWQAIGSHSQTWLMWLSMHACNNSQGREGKKHPLKEQCVQILKVI